MDIGTLYRLYFRDVVLFLQGLTHSETLAEELTQETFFKALDGLKSFDGKQDVRAWLFTVARNCYYSYCRKNHRTVPLEESLSETLSSPSNVEELLLDEDAAFTIHQCLHRLEEPYKEVFSLRVFGELSFEKIGTIFGHTSNWACVTYYRANLPFHRSGGLFQFHSADASSLLLCPSVLPFRRSHPHPTSCGRRRRRRG